MARRQRREADRDFHSSVRLMRRRDIARYSGSTTACLCVNFSAIFYGNWRCKVAMQYSESSTPAHLCVNFNATRCSGTCCGDVQILARFLFGDIRGCAQRRKSRLHLAIRLMQRKNHKAGSDFIGSAVVRKSNAMRRCEVAI